MENSWVIAILFMEMGGGGDMKEVLMYYLMKGLGTDISDRMILTFYGTLVTLTS